MSIKIRLLLSYIAMTVIPVVLFALIAVSLAYVFFQDRAGTGNQKGVPAFWAESNQRDELIAGVKFMAHIDPGRFTDPLFLKTTDEQLNGVHAGLVVKINNRITFASPYVDSADLNSRLEGAGTGSDRPSWAAATGKDRFKIVKYDIAPDDRSAGSVYLFSDLNPFFESMKSFFPLLILSLLVVIGLTNGILTYLVSRSLIKPLYALKHAAEQIKAGDLGHEVNLNRRDEIGELGASFEAMRIRLKDSIRVQLQYEDNRKELIANISHDLKTPITGIKACIEGIQDGIADTGPKRDKYLNMIAKKTEEMDRLIEELFLFSKLDLKRLPFNLEPTDLAAYMRDCVEELRLDPRLAAISMTFTTNGEGPVYVTADREKLHRVIMNIIHNSLKYTNKKQKEIRIELFDGEEEAKVVVRDNGSGIEEDALPHIFDRFYRADPSRNTGGSGLGLAIVKQIVEGQGGRVWAESRIGEGTNIYFTLKKNPLGCEPQ